MGSRVFAVIIGIDQYKSGDIWNLESCFNDAMQMRKWLINRLDVPKDQIALLLNEKATKQNIQQTLNSHLLYNDQIQPGDPILVYFAGHGSSLKTPHDTQSIDVLCPYDHDTKSPQGRVAGISASALSKFLTDLSKSKSNNITLMIDACFTSPPPRSRGRGSIRWTPTNKAVVDDLYPTGQSRCPKRRKRTPNFCNWNNHTLITACKPGATATEGKEGGRFTSSFLEVMRSVPLHSTLFATLMEEVSLKMGESQSPHYSGVISDRLFNAIPFIEDSRYVAAQLHSEKGISIDLGSEDGIVVRQELSLYAHNHIGSCNPVIATMIIHDVHPTWCAGWPKSSSFVPRRCWARVPHNHGISYARLKKAVQALLHSTTVSKSSFPSRPDSTRSVSSISSDLKAKSEFIETARSIFAPTLLVPY